VLSPERASYRLLSSKLFEYGATGRPIVAIRPTADDRALLADHPAAASIDEPDVASVTDAIRRAALSPPEVPAAWLAAFRARYDRGALAGAYADAIRDVLER
jgi:glycosyltransferase involved in cell wall biosynthesis